MSTGISGPKSLRGLVVLILAFFQISCSTPNKSILGGMVTGAVVGAGVGYQFVHHGERKQYETKNTIISAVVFSLLTGGALAWHYRQLEQTKVEISGRYARYRLCNPEEMDVELARQLEYMDESPTATYQLAPDQVGELAISLDDNTKWVYPSFRKRYLLPERAQDRVISKRYIWEIIKPGSFVTRSQNPDYFSESEEVEE